MSFTKRRVVTGHDVSGAAIIVSDGLPARAIVRPNGSEMTHHWYADARPLTPDDGGEEPLDREDFVPPPGGMSWRFMRVPPRDGKPAAPEDDDPRFDRERPGFHATDTIDFIEIISGRIRLELNEAAVDLAAGDCVIQRGTWHRWIVLGDEPCLFAAVMLVSGDGTDPGFRGASVGSQGPRRIVTDGDGILADGCPATASGTPGGTSTVELWHTLGPVIGPNQGGDLPVQDMQLNPPGEGVTWKHVTIPPDIFDKAALMHRTPTIDLVRIASGCVDLELPERDPVRLNAGDCVIQRGTDHAWRGVGDDPFTLSAVMIGLPDG